MANLKQVVYLTQADYAALLNDTHDPKQYTKNGKTIYFDPNTLYITESTVSMSELEGILPVGKGGTGASTLASGYALIGNGTSPVTTRGIRNNTSAGALGWTSNTVDNTLVTTNTLAYWNGAYTGTTSNLSKLGTVTNGTWQATVIGAAYGGTGQNTLNKSANALINALDTGSSDLSANDYVITQYAGGGTTTTTYHRRPANKVINATLVKAALGTNATHGDAYLRKDGTWQVPPYPVTSVAGKTGAVTLAKGDVGLGNVDNTADANKTVLALTDFKVSKYTIPSSKGVRITYPILSPVLISCQQSLGGGRLILLGGGYGAGGTVRNTFTEIVSSSTYNITWSIPNSDSIGHSIEILNKQNSTVAVHVWSSDTCTFTEITTLTTEAMNASLLTTESSVPWSKISSKPTTISGYGITDAKIANGAITLGSNTISSQAAASGGTNVSLVTTGEKYIWNSKTSNTGTVTSITPGNGLINGTSGTSQTAITDSGTISIKEGGVTNAMLAGSIANGKLSNSKVTIAGTDVSLGGSITADTLRTSLGLSNAMHFRGIATVAIDEGTNKKANPTITGYDFGTNGANALAGDVVIDKDSAYEYVWSADGTDGQWERLGGDSSYKTTQTAVSDPTASGNTTSFIDTISQNANGVITVTKKTVPTASDNTAGIMKLGASGGAATYGHTHTLSIADGGSSDTNQKTLAASTKYKLTAGGSTYVFTTPPNTTYANGTGITIGSGNAINHSNSVTAKTSYGSTATTASANGGTIKVTDIQYDAQGHITASTDRTITLSQTTYDGDRGISLISGKLGHSNTAITTQTTQAIYPIKIDAYGHITGYGNAVTVPTKTSQITNDSGFLTNSTLYEANLQWGGKDFAAAYGPIDASMVNELGANRFAFLKAAGLTIEYSTNGGSTWTDYDVTDSQKVGLFSTGYSFYLGKHNTKGSCTVNDMLRVTINTGAANLYTTLNKIVIYMSTAGATVQVLIERALESTPTTYAIHKDWTGISGWSGWNILNMSGLTTYGNTASSQYGRIRFTFKQTAVNTTYASASISKIQGYGGVGWTTPSTMAATGHLYSYDADQNATFPGHITPKTNNAQNLGSSSYKWANVYATTLNGNLAASNLTGTIDNARLNTASTSAAGIVQLSSATDSTSTSLAATASAVKAAYDLAASKTSLTIGTTATTAAAGNHTHGNITNDGKVTQSQTLAANDYIIIGDNSDGGKLIKGPVFDASTATKALTQKGTWETFLTSASTLDATKLSGTIPSGCYTNSRDPGYGQITPANNASTVTALTGNTTPVVATNYSEGVKFTGANKWIVLAGSNSSTAGSDEIKFAHHVPSSISNTGPTSAQTPGYNSTFNIPVISVDEAGHVTGISTTTVKIPATDNTNNAATHTLATTTKYYVTGTTSAATSTAGDSFDTGVYVTANAGELSALKYSVHDTSSTPVEKVQLVWNSTDSTLDFVFT